MPEDLVSRFRIDGEPLSDATVLRRTNQVLVVQAHHRGRRYILKGYGRQRRFDSEVRAYRRWVPALADRAPRLVDADSSTCSLAQTALPGREPDELTSEVLGAAGGLLRSFHDAEPPVRRDRVAYVERRVARQVRARHRLDLPVPETWLRHQVDRTRSLEVVPARPGHGDFAPRNWLVDEHGVLRVIDFENARVQSVAVDFARLAGLLDSVGGSGRQSFSDGYGRALTAAECAHTRVELALNAVGFWVWGLENGDAKVAARSRTQVETMMRGDD